MSRRPASGVLLRLVLFTLALQPLYLSAEGIEVDATKGSIQGRVALSFWPTTVEDSEILAPFGFEVHLVPAHDLDLELTYPCGEWFEPPPGRYRYWIEGNGKITPYSSVFAFRGGPFRGKGGVARVPVSPAGTVALDRAFTLPPAGFLRILHLDSHLKDRVLRREFSRRIPAEAAHRGAAMPAGRVVAALFDSARGEYLGITRPVEVQPGGPTLVAPESPAGGSDLVVLLDRSEILDDHAQAPVEIVARSGERSRAPDVLVPTADRVYAIWYGLAGNYVELEATAAGAFFPSREITLRPGRVEGFRGELQPLPNLDVQIRLPQPLRRQELGLGVSELPDRSPITGKDLAANSTSARFEGLPPRELEVVLQTGPWAFRERVDLREGQDAEVVFEPRLIEVTGRVFWGDEPQPATVSFRSDPFRPREEVSTVTDEDGAYRIALFRSGYYQVGVQLDSVAGGPYVDYLEEPIVEDRVLDFHLPANRFRIRAVDAQTGEGIAGAELAVDNRLASGRAYSQPATTGEDGIADLPPLRPGELLVFAEAKGYLRTGPVTEVVPEEDVEVEVTINLEPVGSSGGLRLLLPDGTPAAGAEVRAQTSLGNTPPIWSGVADPRGLLEIPPHAKGTLLMVRHPQGGGLVHAWHGTQAEAEPEVWTLPPPAPLMTVHVVQPGGDPAPWAQVAIDLGAVRVHGASLAWLASSPVGGANRQGIWQGRNLPAHDLRVHAWASSAVTPAVLSGALDGLAVLVRYPWSNVVEVEVLR